MLTGVLLSHCESDNPNPIVTIPDNNFLSALIDLGVDTNGDGIISQDEAEAIISLDISDQNIGVLTGIQAFVNLKHLDCSSNQLATLDVSHNTALIELWCVGNKITNLDVSNNTALYWLNLVDMPSINKVCVWEMPFPPDVVNAFITDSPNLYFTTDCSGGG